MFTIKVISTTTGKPINGKRVRVGFDGFGRALTDEKLRNHRFPWIETADAFRQFRCCFQVLCFY